MAELDAKTLELLDAVCGKVRAQHGLCAEFHTALLARMRDQLSGYLSGHVPLSVEEALLLVQENFADAAAVANLEAAPPDCPTCALPLSRRIALAFVAMLGVEALTKAVVVTVLAAATLAMRPGETASTYYSMAFSTQMLCSIIQIGVFVFVLVRWQRRVETGEPGGLLDGSAVALAGVLAVAFLAFALLPRAPLVAGRLSAGAPRDIALILTVVFFLESVMWCLGWIWWCDRPPRDARAIGGGLAAWLTWSFFASATYLGSLVQLDLTYHEGTIAYGHSLELTRFFVAELPLPWRLSLELPPIAATLGRLFSTILHLAGTILLAGGLYFAIFRGKGDRNSRFST